MRGRSPSRESNPRRVCTPADTPGGRRSSMSTIETPVGRKARSSDGRAGTAAAPEVSAAAHQAFWLLRIGFTVAPILFGIDKYFNWSVHWPDYLAGWINNIV